MRLPKNVQVEVALLFPLRLWGFLLSVLLCSCSFSVAALSTPSTSLENIQLGEFALHQPDVQIHTPEELMAFADIVNNGESMRGLSVQLEGDIDLAGFSWTPIGVGETMAFSGFFNGNGYTVSNLKTEEEISGGFFGYLSTARVENLTLLSPRADTSTDGFYYASANSVIKNSRVLQKSSPPSEKERKRRISKSESFYFAQMGLVNSTGDFQLPFLQRDFWGKETAHFVQFTKEYIKVKEEKKGKLQGLMVWSSALLAAWVFRTYRSEGAVWALKSTKE